MQRLKQLALVAAGAVLFLCGTAALAAVPDQGETSSTRSGHKTGTVTGTQSGTRGGTNTGIVPP